jgi:hypothetical protein
MYDCLSGWFWFVMRKKYCWFVLREKVLLTTDEQGSNCHSTS